MPSTACAHVPEIAEYLPAARAALAAFGLPETEPHPIGKSENVVFRADAPDGTRWALRLHRPGYHALPALESDREFTCAPLRQGPHRPHRSPHHLRRVVHRSRNAGPRRQPPRQA
jgi:hypothetical protein